MEPNIVARFLNREGHGGYTQEAALIDASGSADSHPKAKPRL